MTLTAQSILTIQMILTRGNDMKRFSLTATFFVILFSFGPRVLVAATEGAARLERKTARGGLDIATATYAYTERGGDKFLIASYHFIHPGPDTILVRATATADAKLLATLVEKQFILSEASDLCVFKVSKQGEAYFGQHKLSATKMAQDTPDGGYVEAIGNPVLKVLGYNRTPFSLRAGATISKKGAFGILVGQFATGEALDTPITLLDGGQIFRGFSGGPVLRSRTNFNQSDSELVGIIQGGDPKNRTLSWCISIEKVQELIGGADNWKTYPPSTWPKPLFNGEVYSVMSSGFETKILKPFDIEFVRIPSGFFNMGSPDKEVEREGDRETQHTVKITKDFWMSTHEITQQQWKSVMGTTVHEHWETEQGVRLARQKQTNIKSDGALKPVEGKNFPMVYVNHAEATQFADKLLKLSRMTKESDEFMANFGDDWIFDLPTEAQWEYACRAGTRTATSFGKSLSATQANFDGDHPYNGGLVANSPMQPTEVCSYNPNPWGLFDMHGNVWEICRDGFTVVVDGKIDPIVKLEALPDVVVRGGSWIRTGAQCRSAVRGNNSHSLRSNELGFRIIFEQKRHSQ